MSIRVAVLTIIVLWLCVYSWRNWFRALCSAIVLMAFLENPEVPKKIFGILGFNLWNLLLLNILGSWLISRQTEGLTWDFPRSVKVAFFLYLGVIVWAFSRLVLNPTEFYSFGTASIVVDYFIDPLKFLIPCFLLYDGCRSEERIFWGLSAIVLLYFLLSVQVVRYMGPDFALSGDALSRRAAKVISHSVGYNRVDMSMMLAGASWAALVFSRLMWTRTLRWMCWGAAAIILLGQAETGGRTGYITWGLVGLVLCLVRWRKALPIIPVAIVLVTLAIPGVRQRMLEGFGGRHGGYIEETDESEITSGRILVWPYVLEKIEQAPILGYGRLAMIRTGLADQLTEELNDTFAHPHNAYLEMLLDDGLVGFLCVLPIYCVVLRKSTSLFKDRENISTEVAGGIALALFLALVFAAFGAQTFYPREGVVGMWAAAGIALRVWVERERERAPILDSAYGDDINEPGLAEFFSP